MDKRPLPKATGSHAVSRGQVALNGRSISGNDSCPCSIARMCPYGIMTLLGGTHHRIFD